MNLYAITRATKLLPSGKYIQVKKGHGSNEQLNIFINIDSEEPRFKLFITKQKDGSTTFRLTDSLKPFPKNLVFEEIIEQTKGEKKKSETEHNCRECNHSMSDAGEVWVCDNESCGYNCGK